MRYKGQKRVALFGATGSIGRQTLDVLSRSDCFKVVVMSAKSRWEELARLALDWQPDWITIADKENYPDLKEAVSGTEIRVEAGSGAAAEAAAKADYDICLNGLVGVAGLLPSYYALERGIDLALANKESLVLAGELLNRLARRTQARIIPIDSEHSALLQCLQGERKRGVKRLILTASGGPFREWPLERIAAATVEEALQHPTWRMGPKITIDSATLMNKGLEVIEAHHLFGVPAAQIEARIHPVSIVHSMVEFVDGSFKAQLGTPDMRLPIQYALNYPVHKPLELRPDDPVDWPALEFHRIEPERYPCLGLAYRALEAGGTATAVLNGADEEVVGRFLNGELGFGDIPVAIGAALDAHIATPADDIDQILRADLWGREFVANFFTPR